jgi:hypothetical protein
LYPHQWLWDSCFIAIGLRHLDVQRAQKEILSLLRGQWSNGMLPNIIFADGDSHRRDKNMWRSWLSPHAPDDVATTGITQPPLVAEAVVRVGEKLSLPERRTWYQTVYPALLAYHLWLYTDRDPHGEGLVLQIHPWESGLDNSPPWINQLYQHQMPLWASVLQYIHADTLINFARRDTRRISPGERISNIEALLYYDVVRRLRRKAYDTETILTRSLFSVEDLVFNCIFMRANSHLEHIAATIGRDLPDEFKGRHQKSKAALEQLWDAYSGQYYSRNFTTHKLIKEPTIATLMPLYSGAVTKERAGQLVALLTNKEMFAAPFPIPTVPLNSPWFKPKAYWQGPSWVNTNWLVIDGLRRYGYGSLALALQKRTLQMVAKSGYSEYFSPKDGSPAGAKNFSWTAALTIDLIKD